MAQTQKFRGAARRVQFNPTTGATEFYYRNTAVVTIYPDKTVRLNSGGWRTATTKTAMNQVANEHKLGFGVYQQKGEWYVLTTRGEVPYHDNMLLVPVGSGGYAAVTKENTLLVDTKTAPVGPFDTQDAARAAALAM